MLLFVFLNLSLFCTVPRDPRRAIPQRMTFVVPGRPDIDMDLTGNVGYWLSGGAREVMWDNTTHWIFGKFTVLTLRQRQI